MKYILITPIIFFLCAHAAFAQTDSNYVERIRFVGIKFNYRQRTQSLPAVPADAYQHFTNFNPATVYVGEQLLYTSYLDHSNMGQISLAIPIQRSLEIEFSAAAGLLAYQNHNQIITAVTNTPNTNDYDVFYSYSPVNKLGYLSEIQIQLNQLIIQRDRFQLGVGLGFGASRFRQEYPLRYSIHKDAMQMVAVPIRIRVYNMNWLELVPEVSFRYGGYRSITNYNHLYAGAPETGQLMVGLRAGLLIGKVVKRRVRPDHWYVRNFED